MGHDATASKQMPFPKALAPHDCRVAYAKLVSNMKDLSETLAADEKSLVMAEVLYNFTRYWSKASHPRGMTGSALETKHFSSSLHEIVRASIHTVFENNGYEIANAERPSFEHGNQNGLTKHGSGQHKARTKCHSSNSEIDRSHSNCSNNSTIELGSSDFPVIDDHDVEEVVYCSIVSRSSFQDSFPVKNISSSEKWQILHCVPAFGKEHLL